METRLTLLIHLMQMYKKYGQLVYYVSGFFFLRMMYRNTQAELYICSNVYIYWIILYTEFRVARMQTKFFQSCFACPRESLLCGSDIHE